MYEYKIKKVLKVYDGDTITVEIDLGCFTTVTKVVRLLGIDTPEVRGDERPEGLVARDYLRNWLDEAIRADTDIIIRTHLDKTGKYGRLLGELFINNISVNEHLIREGYATVYGE